jgi:hypothetical protein
MLKLSNGLLIGGENGLFKAEEGEGALQRLSAEETVNDVQPDHQGFLVGTDSGLFRYDPESSTRRWTAVGGYTRSVRQVYRYSDYECFLATQDGLFYLEGENLRQLGKNTEIQVIAGKLLDAVICIADSQIGIGTGEHVEFFDCKSPVTAATVLNESLFIGTLGGLFSLHDSAIVEVRTGLQVRDIVGVGARLLVASSEGLKGVQPSTSKAVETNVLDGDFQDLQLFPGGILAVGNDRLYILDAEGVPLFNVSAPNSRKCWQVRQFEREIVFCLNNGVLRGEVGTTDIRSWKFQEVTSPVRDVALLGKALMLATDAGIIKLPTERSRWTSELIMGAIVVGTGVAVLFWWGRRRPVIFISYRRGDSRDAVGRVRHQLAATFGGKHVRVDVHDIQPGVDYREEIRRNLEESQVVLVMIGPGWLQAKDKDGYLRLFAERDYVRYEIETAMTLNKPIIPVLQGNAEMPPENELPKSISQLSYVQCNRLRYDPDFDLDFADLVRAIRRWVWKRTNKYAV